MEVDEIETPEQACKYSRVDSNGKIDSSKLATSRGGEEGSRIIRVSRASGGKDRHSKVWTAKGPRDRRVRLSVTTAIQFYDLQDRLGYDQPSKAIEWLIKAAADAINDLPSLEQQQLDSKPGCSSSSCSNNSETNKGSEFSLSQNKANQPSRVNHVVSSNMPQSSSLTQLLTVGMTNLNETNNGEVGLFHKHSRDSTTSMADYFSTGFMGLSSSRAPQIQLGNNPSSLPQLMSFGGSENHHNHNGHNQLEQQQFPFGGGNDYNLIFTTSSSSSTGTPSLTAGINNRGTLQSNSPSLLPYLQRFSARGSTLPFFLGNASASPPTIQPPGLQLCYAHNNGPHHKGKGNN